MPEIAEGRSDLLCNKYYDHFANSLLSVARLVHFLRQHLVGKKIAKVQALDDDNIFGKVGCCGPAFENALKGRTVAAAGSQGKYFWLVMDKPPHPVMHLGMTGWIHIQNDRTAYTNYYKEMKPEDLEAWPPKFWKFQIETDGKTPVRVVFTDPRRFGRIRLVDCPGDQIRKMSPLVQNGPDPVVDKEIFTLEYLRSKMQKRHVPLKAFILDQTVISGIGNWVADESLYHARLHPEQYCNEFSDEEIKRLHDSIKYVCQTACDLLADSDQFPEDWLFKHRWGKGKKTANVLPNGEKLAFITVGGRTSCYAPALQKKTGHVAPGIKEELLDADEEPKKPKARKSQAHESDAGEESQPRKKNKVKQENIESEKKPPGSRSANKMNGTPLKTEEEDTGKRRSARLRKI